jgi:hypothetical protein
LIELGSVLLIVVINANVSSSWIRRTTRYSRLIVRHNNYPLATDTSNNRSTSRPRLHMVQITFLCHFRIILSVHYEWLQPLIINRFTIFLLIYFTLSGSYMLRLAAILRELTTK